MSHENVEVVCAQFEATNRRDWGAAMNAYADDVVLVAGTEISPDAGTVRGREAVGSWFGEWFRSFSDHRFEIEEAQALGGRVLLVARQHAHGRSSGVEVEATAAWIYTVRAGKIVRVELFNSRDAALESAGLAE
jgi:ketosteroid isomerase-like protein